MTPTADDMARDLAADLDYATDEVAGPSTAADLAAYSLAATGGWPAAIRRAVAAEARVEELEVRLARLPECPHCRGTGHVEATRFDGSDAGPCGECRATGVDYR